MGKIISLSEHVIAKIAAGEVIERPAYIVKELVENAIDAGARHIKIAIEEEGLRKVDIIDDGIGMDRDDIQLSFKRHTTSKIVSDQDLFTVKSMGFRGEALASIASIGKLTIRSRSKGMAFGTEVVIVGSEVQRVTAKGMPYGTQVLVEDVFSQVPVRKKFLQSPQFEYRLILTIVTRFAMAFPSIAFDFSHDGKRVFTLPAATRLIERSESLIPSDILGQLFPVYFNDEYIAIEGYTSPPQLNYKTQRNMELYVNRRFIRESKIISIIKDVYATLLEPAAFPYTVLFITVPHHLVDVNVHPRKETVHFLESERIFTALRQAIFGTLSKQNLRFYDRQAFDGGTTTYAAQVLKEKVVPKQIKREPIRVSEIVQMHNTYLIIPTEKGVLMIDQHAAHERILFEQFQNAFIKEKKSGESAPLSKPIHITVTLQEKELLKEKQEEMVILGFDIALEKRTAVISKVPKLFKDRDIQGLIRDMLDDLFAHDTINAYDAFSNTMLEYLACRSAIKAGDVLTKIQAKELIEELNKTENPFTCPHGRPIQVEMELDYLHKLFKRM